MKALRGVDITLARRACGPCVYAPEVQFGGLMTPPRDVVTLPQDLLGVDIGLADALVGAILCKLHALVALPGASGTST